MTERRDVTPEGLQKEYEAAHPPWWTNPKTLAAMVGFFAYVGCAFAPPQYQGPCHKLQEILEVAAHAP